MCQNIPPTGVFKCKSGTCWHCPAARTVTINPGQCRIQRNISLSSLARVSGSRKKGTKKYGHLNLLKDLLEFGLVLIGLVGFSLVGFSLVWLVLVWLVLVWFGWS